MLNAEAALGACTAIATRDRAANVRLFRLVAEVLPLVGAAAATALFRWLVPAPPR